MFFAQLALLLTGEQARGIVGAHAVAVGHQQDHVLGTRGVGLAVEDRLDGVLPGGEPCAAGLRQIGGLCRGGGGSAQGQSGNQGAFHVGVPSVQPALCRGGAFRTLPPIAAGM